MRRPAILLFLALSVLGVLELSCASKPAPSVAAPGTPRFPAFAQPPVPTELTASKAVSPYNLGWSLFQSGDFKTATRAYASALQLAPSFYPAETAWGYLELARKETEAALPHFDRALAERATYASALVGRGQALADLNRDAEAVAAFESALAAEPTLTDLRARIDVLSVRGLERNLAAAREAARANRNDEAIRLYQAAIARSPDSAFLYRELGIVERRTGDTEQALANFRQAVALDSSDAVSLAEAGDLLDARGDIDGALAAYGSALSIEGNAAIEAKRDALMAKAALSRLPEEYRTIPDAPQVTRAGLAALVAIRLSPLLQSGGLANSVVITDVRSTWAEPWIMSVARAGVMDPFENHTFQPAAIVRRLDLAQTVSRLLQRIAQRSPSDARAWQNAAGRFSDIGQGNLAYPAASAAVAAGVMSVGANLAFEPSRPVTGAEAVAAIRRLEQLARLPDASRR